MSSAPSQVGQTLHHSEGTSGGQVTENVRHNIVSGTEASAAAKKSSGRAWGHKETLPAATKASVKKRAIASQDKVLDIRDFLDANPEVQNLTRAQIAERLNAANILSGRNNPWNKNSLGRQLRLAREELKLLSEPDDDDFHAVAE